MLISSSLVISLRRLFFSKAALVPSPCDSFLYVLNRFWNLLFAFDCLMFSSCAVLMSPMPILFSMLSRPYSCCYQF